MMVASALCLDWFVIEVILFGWLGKWIGWGSPGQARIAQTHAFRSLRRLLDGQYSEACMMVRTRRVTVGLAGSSLPML